jgi:hypothetical protein
MIPPRISLASLAVALVTMASPLQVSAGILNPLDFASLGAFPTASGGYFVDTSLGQAPTIKLNGVTVATGVISGNTAVFDFDSVAITTNMSFRVNGGSFSRLYGGLPFDSYGFALLSRGDLSLAANSSVTGTTVSQSFPAGPPGGGLGGTPGSGQSGSFGGFGNGGLGGGLNSGSGGNGPGGFGYGAALGGARGQGGTGGNGGGSIELGALGAVVIGGTIDVHATNGTFGNGGGGGGGGGSISLHGASVALTGTLIAFGGNGGYTYDSVGTNGGGGGGGGGDVIVQTTGAFLNTGTINVAGGIGGADPVIPSFAGRDGGPGSVGVFVSAVPEPSSLVLAIVGTAGLVIVRRRRPDARPGDPIRGLGR